MKGLELACGNESQILLENELLTQRHRENWLLWEAIVRNGVRDEEELPDHKTRYEPRTFSDTLA